jgi:hypothetical protein
MAILIVEHNGTVEGASLRGRVLIGRRASNHVVINDPSVSRIHAWIDTAGRQFCVTDAGSRTGTFVNGHRVAGGKAPLRHGDRITVGPARLIFRTDAALPAGVSQLHFAECSGAADASAGRAAPDAASDGDGGILFDCTKCRAPLWIAAAFAGRTGKCRFCDAVQRVPGRGGAAAAPPPPPRPPPPAAAPAGAAVASPSGACGACQSSIEPGEPLTTCPECGLTFHAGCWAENYGCSAYGCSQANALLPKREGEAAAFVQPEPVGSTTEGTAGANERKATSEYALLAGSVLGVVFGALTFGVPALLACVAAVVYITRRRRGDRVPRVVLAAALLALGGAAAGAVVSYVWWMGGDAGVVRGDEP